MQQWRHLLDGNIKKKTIIAIYLKIELCLEINLITKTFL
jgi:hypothetical protein